MPACSCTSGPPSVSLHSLTAVLPRLVLALVARRHDVVLLWLLNLLRVNDPLLDVGSKAVEGIVHADVGLCRHLEEWDAELVGQGLAALHRDGALFLPVAFVANEDLVYAFGCMLFNVGEPSTDVCCALVFVARKNILQCLTYC